MSKCWLEGTSPAGNLISKPSTIPRVGCRLVWPLLKKESQKSLHCSRSASGQTPNSARTRSFFRPTGPHLQPMSQAQAKHGNPFLEISANGLRKQGSPSTPEEPRHNVLYLPRGAKAAKKMGEQRGIPGVYLGEGWKTNITG